MHLVYIPVIHTKDNEELHNIVKHLEKEYKKKSNNLDFDFNNRKDELEEKYKEK